MNPLPLLAPMTDDALTPGRPLAPADLARAAAAALARAGKSQVEAAEELGQTKAAVSMAVSGYRERGHALRIEIIERYGGVRVSGPVYYVEPGAPSEDEPPDAAGGS